MSTRIYTVTDGTTERLVRANNRAQAISHVARSVYTTRVATQDDLVSSLQAGGKVEEAGAEVEEAQAATRTCSDERPCINCYADQGDCLGPAPETVRAREADEERYVEGLQR